MSRRFEPLEGERIIVDEPIHWKNHLTSVLAMTLGLFLTMVRIHLKEKSLLNHVTGAIIVPAEVNRVAVLIEITLLLLVVLWAFLRTVDISYIHYYLTNKRIISVSGVIHRTFSEMLLSRCEMVYLNQNPYERMYNCGDILCVSAGAQLFLDDVVNAVAFKQTLMSLLSEQNINIV